MRPWAVVPLAAEGGCKVGIDAQGMELTSDHFFQCGWLRARLSYSRTIISLPQLACGKRHSEYGSAFVSPRKIVHALGQCLVTS